MMATRSISISLDEAQLRQLDQELSRSSGAARGNRSLAVSEALDLWLQQRRIENLQQAYQQLAQLKGGDLAVATSAAAAMGAAALAVQDD